MLIKMQKILSLIIILFQIVKLHGSVCTVKNNNKTLECKSIRNFQEVFHNFKLFSHINELIISFAELKIPNFAFSLAKNLEKVTIEKSFIHRMPVNSFDNANSIKSIILRNNQIDAFDQFMLDPLANSLVELTLADNKLNNQLFKLLKAVEGLELLIYLDLSSNQITTKLLSLIKFPQSLKTLILNNNLITSDGLRQINYLNFLNQLYLNENQINKIEKEDFNNFYNLKTLSLSQNDIQRIPSQAFYKLQNLRILQLQQQINGITSIDNYAFSIDPHLGYEKIDLSNNKITNFAQDCIFCSNYPERKILVDTLNIQDNNFHKFNPLLLVKLGNTTRAGAKPNLNLNQITCNCNLNQLNNIFHIIGNCYMLTYYVNVSTYLLNNCNKNLLVNQIELKTEKNNVSSIYDSTKLNTVLTRNTTSSFTRSQNETKLSKRDN